MSNKDKNTINVNRKKLSSEEVKAKQQFGKVLHHHQQLTKRPIYEQRKFYFVLLVIFTLILLIYLGEKEKEKEKAQIENREE